MWFIPVVAVGLIIAQVLRVMHSDVSSSFLVEGLFPGEQLIRSVSGKLFVGTESAYGAILLTDMRIIWAPTERIGGVPKRIASAMHSETIVITLGEIRHASTAWNPIFATLRLETPYGAFKITSAMVVGFGPWLHYIGENSRNLLRTEEAVMPMPESVAFGKATGVKEKHRRRLTFAITAVLLLVEVSGLALSISPVLLTVAVGVGMALFGAFLYAYARTR